MRELRQKNKAEASKAEQKQNDLPDSYERLPWFYFVDLGGGNIEVTNSI